MKAIRFTLKGKTAFYKMPEVNSYYYFSYGNIHKPALLGMLGAIVGYAGYQQSHFQEEYYKFNDGFPEYYHRLKDLQVSIVPKAKQGYFCKKIQKRQRL